jgi:hypothetical protein
LLGRPRQATLQGVTETVAFCLAWQWTLTAGPVVLLGPVGTAQMPWCCPAVDRGKEILAGTGRHHTNHKRALYVTWCGGHATSMIQVVRGCCCCSRACAREAIEAQAAAQPCIVAAYRWCAMMHPFAALLLPSDSLPLALPPGPPSFPGLGHNMPMLTPYLRWFRLSSWVRGESSQGPSHRIQI